MNNHVDMEDYNTSYVLDLDALSSHGQNGWREWNQQFPHNAGFTAGFDTLGNIHIVQSHGGCGHYYMSLPELILQRENQLQKANESELRMKVWSISVYSD